MEGSEEMSSLNSLNANQLEDRREEFGVGGGGYFRPLPLSTAENVNYIMTASLCCCSLVGLIVSNSKMYGAALK